MHHYIYSYLDVKHKFRAADLKMNVKLLHLKLWFQVSGVRCQEENAIHCLFPLQSIQHTYAFFSLMHPFLALTPEPRHLKPDT